MYKVTYRGFLETVVRYFATKKRAEQWTRQVGKWGIAKIEEV